MDKRINNIQIDKNKEKMNDIIEQNRNLNAREFLELIRSKYIEEEQIFNSSECSSGYGGYGLDII